MAKGKVLLIGFDERPLAKPDPRSGKLIKGWGRYIIIEHEDGSKSLYAHLQKDGVKVALNETVSAGSIIALSDDSGGSQAAHLHVEYVPNGEIFKKPSKVNADSCIGNAVSGNIQVSDNGSAADDAFSVAVNGKTICTTNIGASNSCSLGALRTDRLHFPSRRPLRQTTSAPMKLSSAAALPSRTDRLPCRARLPKGRRRHSSYAFLDVCADVRRR